MLWKQYFFCVELPAYSSGMWNGSVRKKKKSIIILFKTLLFSYYSIIVFQIFLKAKNYESVDFRKQYINEFIHISWCKKKYHALINLNSYEKDEAILRKYIIS